MLKRLRRVSSATSAVLVRQSPYCGLNLSVPRIISRSHSVGGMCKSAVN